MKRKVDFQERIEEALKFYGLSSSDLAKLINASSSNIDDILKGEAGLNYIKMKRISEVFDLNYYEFGNPEVEFVAFEYLNEKTKEVIKNRKKTGKDSRDKTRYLAIELDRLIKSELFNKPIISSQVFSRMEIDKAGRKSTEITNLLSKEPRNSIIYRIDCKSKKDVIFIHKDYFDKFNDLSDDDLIAIIKSYP